MEKEQTKKHYIFLVCVCVIAVLALLGMAIYSTVQTTKMDKNLREILDSAPINEADVFLPGFYDSNVIVSPTKRSHIDSNNIHQNGQDRDNFEDEAFKMRKELEKKKMMDKSKKRNIKVNKDHHIRDTNDIDYSKFYSMQFVDAFILIEMLESFAADTPNTVIHNITESCISKENANPAPCLVSLAQTIFNSRNYKGNIAWSFTHRYGAPSVFDDEYFDTIRTCDNDDCPCTNCLVFLNAIIEGTKILSDRIADSHFNSSVKADAKTILSYQLEEIQSEFFNVTSDDNICKPVYSGDSIYQPSMKQKCSHYDPHLQCMCVAVEIVRGVQILINGPDDVNINPTVIDYQIGNYTCAFGQMVGSDAIIHEFCHLGK